jgi:predicted nucleotidyltransferase
VQKRSYGSVTVFWLDRSRAVSLLEEAARELGADRPEVLYVGLFGSLAEGRAIPGSDADLLLVLSQSERRFLDRPLDYSPFFSDVGLGVDLFCYLREEIGEVPFARRALASSRPLYGTKPAGR